MVVRASGAEVEELEAVYRAGFERFVRVATVITHDPDAARDAVQAAFVAAIRGRRGYRRTGPLEGWIWRIVVNEARRLARTVPDGPEPPELPAANGNGHDEVGVRRYVAALPQRQRETVFLRYFADLDYRTIARLLDLEPGTVSATLSAAHQTLRKRLEATTR
jgi:RNA polymerase sigma factor (sigma-70 family)